MWTTIAAHITQAIGCEFEVTDSRAVGGGCINQGYRLRGNRHTGLASQPATYFVKLNQAAQVAMFEAEALGLQQMRAHQTIRVPEPICWGTTDTSAYLVLEWVELGAGDRQTWFEMGRQLAASTDWAINSNWHSVGVVDSHSKTSS